MFKRKAREATITVNHYIPGIQHTIAIKKEPEPKPVMGWLIITNEIGQQWRTNPFHINGKSGMPIYIDKSWLTGNDEDRKLPPIRVEMQLEY